MPLSEKMFENISSNATSKSLDVLKDAFEQVCGDAKILNENPHMIRYCCPPVLPPLSSDASDAEKKERKAHLDVCYDAQFMPPLRPDHVESKKAQEVIETVFGELCLNNRFNAFHADLCCFVDRPTHQSVGLSGDNQDVARACALPRV